MDKILIQLKSDPKVRFLGLEGFMVKPIQRLPKYILLTNDFLKHTPEDHPLFDIYREAKNKF